MKSVRGTAPILAGVLLALQSCAATPNPGTAGLGAAAYAMTPPSLEAASLTGS